MVRVSVATKPPIPCKALGHDFVFRAESHDLTWECRRCGAPGGIKRYDEPAQAERYARAFEAERERAGSRFMLSTVPLWLWRKLRGR